MYAGGERSLDLLADSNEQFHMWYAAARAHTHAHTHAHSLTLRGRARRVEALRRLVQLRREAHGQPLVLRQLVVSIPHERPVNYRRHIQQHFDLL